MVIPKIQRVQKTLVKTIAAITRASGSPYDVTVRALDAYFQPQADVEVTVDARGFEYLDDAPMMSTDVDLLYQIDVAVARKLANDSTPINEICLALCAEVERRVMADVSQGGDAQDTILERAIAQDDGLGEGFYAWSLIFRIRVRYPLNQPFQS